MGVVFVEVCPNQNLSATLFFFCLLKTKGKTKAFQEEKKGNSFFDETKQTNLKKKKRSNNLWLSNKITAKQKKEEHDCQSIKKRKLFLSV